MSWERSKEIRDEQAVLREVIPEVLERQAFLFCDPAEAGVDSPEKGLCARMEFQGPSRGTLELIVPDELGIEAAANLLGIEPEDERAEQNVRDALAEILNVVCGQLLTALYGEEPVFDLSIPQVDRAGEEEWRRMAERAGAAWFSVEGSPMAACLEVEEERV